MAPERKGYNIRIAEAKVAEQIEHLPRRPTVAQSDR
jgi:hypothetical protein